MMQLNTTFRGLNESDAALAAKTLERQINRIDRLADHTTIVRAVIDGGAPESRVALSTAIQGEEFNAQSSDYDLLTAINTACERLRSQLARHRHRRETQRNRNNSATE